MKTIALIITFALLLCAYAFGQDSPIDPGVSAIFEFIRPLLMGFAEKYPIITTLAMISGTCRMLMKPMMSFLMTFVLVTPSPKDDEILKAVMESKAYKVFSYFLDWMFSLKLPQLEKK